MKKFPRWLNLLTVLVFLLIPLAFILIFLDYNIIGLSIMGIFFWCIWVLGNMAAYFRKAQGDE